VFVDAEYHLDQAVFIKYTADANIRWWFWLSLLCYN